MVTIPDAASTPSLGRATWLSAFRRYLVFSVTANLVWEVAQLPLYTIWREEPAGRIAFAVVHCLGGDALLAATALLGALLLLGNARWPHERYIAVAVLATAVGIAVTIILEWLNVEVRRSWAYSNFMPTLPVIGTGLSPLAQWIVIPVGAFWWARPGSSR